MKKNKKIAAIIAAGTFAAAALAGCSNAAASSESSNSSSSSSSETSKASSSSVSITMLNSKMEIQPQLEEMAKKYKEQTGVSIEVYSTANGASPAETIAQKYAAGDPPTLAMLDGTDILTIAKEKALDLSSEKWASDGGSTYGISIDGTLYSFPFCIEGRGLIYNKTIIEKLTGKEFNPDSIKSMDALKKLMDELVAAGMEHPMVINKEDWSLGAHYLATVYEEQDGTAAGAYKFTEGLTKGTEKLIENKRFNTIMDTFDMLKEYNINKADPMAADYDLNASYVAEGKSAFWFNGNWAWAEISEYVDDSTEMGIMPLVQNTSEDDFANNRLCASGSKQVMIDKIKATPEQQQAAKDFLNWLVYDEAGQSVLVNDCSLVPAFKNITLEVKDPLGQSIKKYVDAGNTVEGFNGCPGDHWSTLGASMQKYLAGQIDRAGLASEVEAYWAKQAK